MSQPRLNNFEEALQKTGWGLYYKFLVGFASANIFTNGFVLLSFHFALPLSACDTLLTFDDILAVFTSFIIGKAIGGFFLSSVADNSGKKCMISKSLIIIFGSCFIGAFSHNVYTLHLSAFCLGSGLQSNMICMKIYLCEILPKNKRGFYMVLPDIFWTFGYFSTAIFMYCFGTSDDSNSEHRTMDMRLASWRIILAIGGGLCLTIGCSTALLEASPRFLLFKRRIISASLLLKQFYAINKSKYSETFEIHSQQLLDLVRDFNLNIYPEAHSMWSQTILIIKIMLKMLKILFSPRFIKIIMLLILIKLPTIFGISGFAIAFSQFLNRNATKENVTGSIFIHLNMIKEGNCTISLENSNHLNFLLISLNILPGQLILMWIIDKVGRKFPIFVGLFICSFTSSFLSFIQNSAILITLISFFIFGLSIIESTLYVIIIESFPTAIRGTAAGITFFYTYLFAATLQFFLNAAVENFFVIYAALTLGCLFLVCFLPEYKGKPMVE